MKHSYRHRIRESAKISIRADICYLSWVVC